MLDEEIEIKEKQDYLRENILEKGYNVDEFMQYLKVLKGEKGLKVENWSKNDLVKAVLDFKRVNPPEQFKIKDNQVDNKYPGQEEEKEDDNAQNNENESNVNNNNQNKNQMQAKELLQCKISEKNEISNVFNLTITLSLPKVIEGTLFSKSYITYLIETKPLGLQVRRRFSDIVWLHDMLKVLYINCIIPPIIKKNYFSGITDVQIQKRMRSMEKFLQEIITHPLLRNSQIFYDFISIRDEKDYNLKKNAYSKMVFPEKAEDIKTLTGEINISINKDKELYAEKIKTVAENNEVLMKKITKEYKILNQQIQSVVSKITDINILWDELYKKSSQNYEGEIMLGAYDSLAKFMEDWAKMQKTQIDLINTKLREYFRYIKYEYHSIYEYHKIYEDKKNDYQNSYQKLSDKKEKLFSGKKVNNWGMDREDLENKILLFKEKELSMEKMLPEETKKVKDKKKLYGSYLNSLIEEYEKITNLNSLRHKQNIVGFIRDMSNTIITFHVSLNQMIAYLDTLKEDLFAVGEK